jgi:hypothetical protein
MAINPNTDFSVGQVLTSTNANQWPRGIMALSIITSNVSIPNAETTYTSVTFTAVANRYYRISWFVGELDNANGHVTTFRFRETSTTGTILAQAVMFGVAGADLVLNMSSLNTFTAGSQTIFARASTPAATSTVLRASATAPAYLMVEDVGPA